MQMIDTFVCQDSLGKRYTVQTWQPKTTRTLPSGKALSIRGAQSFSLEDGTVVHDMKDGSFEIQSNPIVVIKRKV
ncbi:hypothetical protein ABEB22_08835 [Thioclava sp. 'Guangxiensis']|uniref:hypothetical protein n=1 Tax=Thioclava sp. 'Guangxiensis' TaxID=3149044 RepID=UPI003878031F